jgi:hypothetical protein
MERETCECRLNESNEELPSFLVKLLYQYLCPSQYECAFASLDVGRKNRRERDLMVDL